ncbi:hypothetical protein J6590_006912 [Homalodisca vitripennis]|nr:hypothetical protein J6590_006912 [Homalodisca vitripennis]
MILLLGGPVQTCPQPKQSELSNLETNNTPSSELLCDDDDPITSLFYSVSPLEYERDKKRRDVKCKEHETRLSTCGNEFHDYGMWSQ